MKLTLLLDLDDTLLDSNIENFIPAYFKALSDYLKDLVPPGLMINALMGGTKRMMDKIDPHGTLNEVFDEFFYKTIGINHSKLQQKIDIFYDEVFPKLDYLTKQIPEAIEFVKWAFNQHHRVIIATNPLFPLKAIQHRLRWAGLAPEVYPYDMITSFENSHFTKENISYFPEILGLIGWPDDPVIMIGNDNKMDIEPAKEAGFKSFWICDKPYEIIEFEKGPYGRIGEVRSWLKNTSYESLFHSLDKASALIATLRSTPAVLEGLISKLDTDEFGFHSDPQEWSINDVICHLRDVENEVNLPRIKKILNMDNPFIVGEVTDRWAEERYYSLQNGKEALKAFMEARKDSINLVDELLSEWERPARHSIFGSMTLLDIVGIIVGHDKVHIQQIYKIINLIQ